MRSLFAEISCQIASVKDLESEFSAMMKPFEVSTKFLPTSNCHDVTTQGKETEHNWAARERAINRVRGMLKGDVHNRYADTFLACLKIGFIDGSFKTVSTSFNNYDSVY